MSTKSCDDKAAKLWKRHALQKSTENMIILYVQDSTLYVQDSKFGCLVRTLYYLLRTRWQFGYLVRTR